MRCQIKVGDKVANNLPDVDAGTKEQQHVVTALHITYTDRDYTDVTPAGPSTITGTAHHPYWDATTQAWIDGNRLRPGDRLQTIDGLTTLVSAVRTYTDAMVTYNLTVDGVHTYFVLASGTPILVHNGDEELCKLLGVSRAKLNKIVGDAYRDHIADSFRQRGLTVVTDAENKDLLTFETPWGDRTYDIGVVDSNGDVSYYVETKSGDAGKNPVQEKKDKWLESNVGINITYVYDNE